MQEILDHIRLRLGFGKVLRFDAPEVVEVLPFLASVAHTECILVRGRARVGDAHRSAEHSNGTMRGLPRAGRLLCKAYLFSEQVVPIFMCQ